jgi:hypothetical protein
VYTLSLHDALPISTYRERNDKIKSEAMEMAKTYKISKEAIQEIERYRIQNKDKQADKRLYAVKLRGQGKTTKR